MKQLLVQSFPTTRRWCLTLVIWANSARSTSSESFPLDFIFLVWMFSICSLPSSCTETNPLLTFRIWSLPSSCTETNPLLTFRICSLPSSCTETNPLTNFWTVQIQQYTPWFIPMYRESNCVRCQKTLFHQMVWTFFVFLWADLGLNTSVADDF